MKKINRKNLKTMIMKEMKESLTEIIYSNALGMTLGYSATSSGRPRSGSRSGSSGGGGRGTSASGDISGADIALAGGIAAAGAAGAAGLFGGSTPDGNQVSRSQRLSGLTGLPPEVVYAIEMTESSCCGPRAFAFNGHVFLRNLTDSVEISSAESAGFIASEQSWYGDDATTHYEIAYAINPEAAIKGGAWGLYQVLGETSFYDYGTVMAFENAFSSNPVAHSESAFVSWWSDKATYIAAANNGETSTWVGRYFGRRDQDYIDSIEGYMNDYRQEVGGNS